MEKVSVIIPIFNAENILSKCLTSLVHQTYKNIEFICVNDASKDQSIEIIKQYAAKDNRFIIIDKIVNEGVSSARNCGIKISSGKYIMFVDSDDYLEKTYIENMVEEMEEKNSDIVVSGYQRIQKNASSFIKLNNSNYKSLAEAVLYLMRSNVFGYTWNKIIKRKVLIDNEIFFDESTSLFEDQLFYMEYIKNIKRINTSAAIGYNYVINDNSLSNSYRTSRLTLMNQMMTSLERFMEKINMDEKSKNEILYDYSYKSLHECIRQLALNKNATEMKKEIKKWKEKYIINYFINNYKKMGRERKSQILYFLLKSRNEWLLVLFYKTFVFIRR
ncbi:glycosyltransferase family 2 protein [Exiguobacterium sp. s146]|uniref:glycosyltransferase family 2 protein n=1 Tax=Exiguobacterium sp. s146 TaxID=2751223 RepID=UPI001BEA3EB7|nr:glycosyltransferase family 2 protein [Exiguobacterium sp. s146]